MPKLLDQINKPSDLKHLATTQLQDLADEVRHFIIHTVSKTGGHLASNLGVVELTIALHYCLNSPRDKIIFDVGHQSYTHKLLTGRKGAFSTLRQLDGLAGFPRREESPHDPFNTGHASTSISAALGMAVSRDLKGEDHVVTAVIGDGALSGGMAFEALNHAGHLKNNLLVILNSNEMSISPSVGAMAAYLNRLITMPIYNRLREDAQELLSRIPYLGHQIAALAKRVEDGMKNLVVPGGLFQELGFRYFGPIDGHNLPLLIETLGRIKELKGPIFLHVVTRKGKGYRPAEENPTYFHGSSPFEIKTGQPLDNGKKVTYTKVFAENLVELAKQDRRIVAISAAMAEGTGLNLFNQRFPDRFFDVGISESHAVTLAAGMAAEGLRPVVAVYSTFLQRGYDQICHDVCLPDFPVIFALDRAGLVGEDGPTHQGIYDIAYLRHLPNIILAVPRDGFELRLMLEAAITWDHPVAIRYPRGKIPAEATRVRPAIEPGQAEVLCEGDDGVIFALGNMVPNALEVSRILSEENISVGVVNARFVKPLDKELILKMGQKKRPIITLEDHTLTGGFGSAVLEALAEAGVAAGVKRLGLPDKFIEHGDVESLHRRYGLDTEGILKEVREVLSQKVAVHGLKLEIGN
ncbi:MAG: 1-deoxy-D-xylulose-5-phosphate synthase [bacterium]|nr:1-deoxy-D-xylulose-5-phosphate synthase [bacterium]